MEWQSLNIQRDFKPGIHCVKKIDKSYHIPVSSGEILTLIGQNSWQPLNKEEWNWSGLTSCKSHFLGWLREIPLFAEELDSDREEPEGYKFTSLWSFLTGSELSVFYLIGRAKQIVDWNKQHIFCGACGGPTSESITDRSRRCEKCNIPYYPRLSPSIIVLVTKGEELLLARNANTQGSFYSTLAGFVEPGETIEETVHREVEEEVGIKIKNLKYFSSQSWPFPNSLMLGFHAEYMEGEINIQEEEIADARWFHYTDMPNKPAMMSISGWLIDDYIKKLSD